MQRVGLTGGIGAGKSTAAEMLRNLGAYVVHADRLGHETYSRDGTARRLVLERFGNGILSDDGEIDRASLARIVFGDKKERLALEGIVWPEIRKLISIRLAEAEAAGAGVAVVEAAVLLEAGWEDLFDQVWTVETPREVARARLIGRQSISESEADARLAAQLASVDRANRSSVVIENTGTVDELRSAVTAAYKNLVTGGMRRKIGRDPK
jgi:dephospho-CoA kinase